MKKGRKMLAKKKAFLLQSFAARKLPKEQCEVLVCS